MAGKSASEKASRTVTAPLVAVKYENGSAGQLMRGDIVPDEVTKESIALLDELGYLSDSK